MLFLAALLFLLDLGTCLVAVTQFATAYSRISPSPSTSSPLFHSFLQEPLVLVASLPLLSLCLPILLTHELGHFFGRRYHHIRATYPFFGPFPTSLGTFGGAFF